MTDTAQRSTEPTLCLLWALAADAVNADGPTWHTICTIGKVKNEPVVGKAINITRAMADRWIAAFRKRGKEVSFDIHHATLMGAVTGDPRWMIPDLTRSRGLYLDLRRVDDDLQAFIDWTAEGVDLVKTKAFRFFSVEIGKPADLGEETITGGTLTNKPAANVPAIAFTEAAFEALAAHAGGAAVEPPEYPSADRKPVTNKENPMSDEIKALAEKLGCDVSEVETKVAALTAADTVREAKVAALQEQITALQDAEFTRAVASDLLDPGKIKNDEEAISALRMVYDADPAKFTALAESIQGQAVPTGGPKGKDKADETTPAGDTPADPQSVADALHALAEKAMGGDGDLGYQAAFALACEENPKLAELYLPSVPEEV